MQSERADSSGWVQAVVLRYEGPLTRYAARLMGDAEQARDVVQETFLRLCAQERSRVEGHVAEWLFTVCRNRALDIVRRDHRMQPLTDAHMTQESGAAAPPAALEHEEAMSQVLRVLATIPANQQEVIRLKFQEGFSYREISRVTGHSISNVGFLIHTGLKAIRERLKSESGLARKP